VCWAAVHVLLWRGQAESSSDAATVAKEKVFDVGGGLQASRKGEMEERVRGCRQCKLLHVCSCSVCVACPTIGPNKRMTWMII
jgi:hypothetical protein